MTESASVACKLDIVKVREGGQIRLRPDDRVMFMGSKDDLNLGGTIHTFAVLRPVPEVGERRGR